MPPDRPGTPHRVAVFPGFITDPTSGAVNPLRGISVVM
jgi:hypothetical protein